MAARTDTISGIGSEPTRPLPQNLSDQAVCFFFHQYIISANDGGNPGYLDFLPELYESSDPDGALALSVKAMSYGSLSARSSIKVLAAKSNECYHATLKLVNGMLQSPEEIAQDFLIVAILLLVLFENVTREKPAVMKNHAKGLHALLVLRGEDQLRSSRGWAIFRHVHAHTQTREVELSKQPSPETVLWMQGLDRSFPAARLMWEKYRISQVRATATEILALPPDAPDAEEKLLSLLSEARELDAEAARWSDDAPPSCRYRAWKLNIDESAKMTADLLDNDELLSEPSDGSTQYILTYTDVWFASLWHGHHTSRLILHETLLRIAQTLNLAFIAQDSITSIQQLLLKTCASIAFSVGDVRVRTDESSDREWLDLKTESQTEQGGGVGAYSIVWSLRHVVSCEFATNTQIHLASEALHRIAALFGIRQAVRLADRQYQCHQ